MENRMKFRLFTILSIVILCIGLTFKYFTNDTFYIIKLGNFIVHNGIDKIDHYSWVSQLPYTYPHWIYDIFIYYFYHYFGYFGIYVSTIISFIVLILVIYYVSLKMIKNELLSFFISIICVFRLSTFAVARAQIISLPMFILEVYFINELIKKGMNRYVIYLCLLSLLIANIHGTAWLMFFVLFLPFIGEYLVYIIIHNKKIRQLYKIDKYKDFRIVVKKIKNIDKIFISFILCFLMGLFTPSRICYTYVFRIMMGDSQTVLLEHFPIVIVEHPFFVISLLMLVITLIFTDVKVKLREVFMIGGITLLCIMSMRHLAFYYSICLIYIGLIIYRALVSIGDNTFNVLGDIIINNKLYLLLILVIIVMVSGSQFYRHSREDYILKKKYPVDAVKYIKDNLNYEDIRLYNGYNYGSYLLMNDIPVFIDSRCDLYLKEFNGMDYSIFDDMNKIEFKYEKKFKKYNVTHVILDKNDSFYMILLKDINYNTIYQDKYFILFERVG